MLTATVGKSLMTKGYCKGLRTHSRRSERPKIMGVWRCKVSLRCGIRNNLRPLHLAVSSPYSTWPNFAHPSHCRQASGAKLGNPSNIAAAGVCGRQIQIAAADQFASGLLPVIEAIRRTGATTLEAITRALNDRGMRPARGTRWYASSVANLLSRANKLAEVL
jgi:hypothetical protein